MVQSRKRRRRRKKDKTLEQNTSGIDIDKGEGESQQTTILPQQSQPTSNGRMSNTCTTVLDKHQILQTNSASAREVEGKSSKGGGSFQLFVRIEGGSDEERPTLISEHGQEESKREKMKLGTKQALRGGSAHYCDRRAGRRLMKGSLCETKHHPNAELSNCHSSIASIGEARSNSVSKQGGLRNESHDRLKGKELRQSHTPPGVDTRHHTSEVTQCESSKSRREASMEKAAGHRRRVTRGSSGHRQRVMRHRKGRRITQVGQSAARLNIAQPYMYVYTIL